MKKTLRTKIAVIDREMDEHSVAVAEKRREIQELHDAVESAKQALLRERNALAAISQERLCYSSFGAAFFARQEERIDECFRRICDLEARIEGRLDAIRTLFGEKEKYKLLLNRLTEKEKHIAALKEEAESDERLRQRNLRGAV